MHLQLKRLFFPVRIFLLSLLLSGVAQAFEPFTVLDIRVEGLQRISAGTVFNYLPIKVGQTVDSQDTRQCHQGTFQEWLF